MFKKEDILLLFLIAIIVFFIAFFLQGCCRYCKIEKPPAQIIEVPVLCKLPNGPGELPVPARAKECLDKHICYDISNVAKLAERDSKLKQWIRETKAKCGKKDD